MCEALAAKMVLHIFDTIPISVTMYHIYMSFKLAIYKPFLNQRKQMSCLDVKAELLKGLTEGSFIEDSVS
jgi:hypothetical protein